MPIWVASPGFRDGESIPRQYSADSGERSPPLRWDGVPNATRSLALLLDDIDVPVWPRCHWVLFDLPADRRDLPEHLSHQSTLEEEAKDGIHAKQGRNDFGTIGYTGPGADGGWGHRYTFTL